jgi:hypothetical protein
MSIIEMARKQEDVDNLNDLSNEELDAEEARLQLRRVELQKETESVIEKLKRISEANFERNIPNN